MRRTIITLSFLLYFFTLASSKNQCDQEYILVLNSVNFDEAWTNGIYQSICKSFDESPYAVKAEELMVHCKRRRSCGQKKFITGKIPPVSQSRCLHRRSRMAGMPSVIRWRVEGYPYPDLLFTWINARQSGESPFAEPIRPTTRTCRPTYERL